MAIDIENLPKDLKEQEEKDAMVEGATKGIMGFIGLFTAPWLGVAVASAGVLTYAASFFVSGEKRLEYQSNGIKAMLGGLVLSFPVTSFLVMIEGGVTAFSGRRDGPFAPFANISRFIAEGITGYPQTGVERTIMHREMQQQQQSEEKAQQPTQNIERQSTQSIEAEDEKRRKAAAPIEQQPPAQIVDMGEVQKAKTYAAAQTEYDKSLKSPQAKKFDVVEGYPKKVGENTIIVFDHPEHKGDEKHQVTYTIGKDGKPISIVPGEETTCTLPPIQKGTDGFEIVSIKEGKQTLLHATSGARTNIVQAEQAVKKPPGTIELADLSSSKSPTSTGTRPSTTVTER